MDKKEDHWHLDKRVPVSLIVAILLQTAGAVWFASSLNERMNNVETWQASRANVPTRITTLEIQIMSMKEGITEIKNILLTYLQENRNRILDLERGREIRRPPADQE